MQTVFGKAEDDPQYHPIVTSHSHASELCLH